MRTSRPLSRNLLLLSLDWTRPKDPPLSLGQASILAKLQKEKISVKHQAWSVNNPNFNPNDVYDYVMRHVDDKVDLALGTYIWHEPHTQALLNALKKSKFPGRIILGGPQISYTKQGLEKYYPQADIFIRGYGEDALSKLYLSDSEKPTIAGVHYAGEPDLGLSATANLETLPSPYLSGLIKPQSFMRWETQRGCPFRCSFCQHRESDSSMTRRQFSNSRIMEEADWILSHPIIDDLAILDPTFNSGKAYLSILDRFIAGKYKGKLALQCRAEMVNDDFLNAIEELNKTAHVVLEFGLQTTNQLEAKIIKRPNNLKKVSHILSETKRRGISVEVSLIFGLPGQTVSSFKASIDFCKEHGVPTIYAFPLMLLRGTPLHAEKQALGLIESTDLNLNIDRAQDNIPHVVSSSSFSYTEWKIMASMAEELNVYNTKQAKGTEFSSDQMKAGLNTASFWKQQKKEPVTISQQRQFEDYSFENQISLK